MLIIDLLTQTQLLWIASPATQEIYVNNLFVLGLKTQRLLLASPMVEEIDVK